MDIRITCPLGSKCEEVKDGYVERCAWYTEMSGKDAAGNDHDDWKCAITWFPILQVEMSATNRQVAASVQSMRNEQTKRQDIALQSLRGLKDAKAITA